MAIIGRSFVSLWALVGKGKSVFSFFFSIVGK